MAPSKATMLSTLIDMSSADEQVHSDIDMMPTPDSQPENNAPPTRKQGRTKGATAASKAPKTKAAPRRVSSGANAKTKSRKALAERTNVPNDGNETEEVDDFEDDLEAAPAKPAKRGKAAKEEPAPAKSRTTKTAAKGTTVQKKPGRSKHVSEPEVPESQPEPMDTEQTEVEDATVMEPAPIRKRAVRQPLPTQLSSRARSTSRQPDPYSRHKRTGSASDTERAGEPALRRKLGEMTRKFENLDLKYRNLKELGSSDTQNNFDRLKKTTDQRARDQDEVIASLKKELAAQRSMSTDARTMRSQNISLQADNQRISSEAKALSTTIASLQNDVKTLQAKLAAARSNSVELSKAVPGSAVKARGPAAMKAAESENERMRIMQMKEDLYSDLTGLMIHNIKRVDEEDIFDCIQTGRNGTLRFHLSVSRPDAKATATPGTSYEEEEFAYAPLLDEKNDMQLLEILPDYLTEEIVFPRPSAARFYQKVIDCMSRKFVEE